MAEDWNILDVDPRTIALIHKIHIVKRGMRHFVEDKFKDSHPNPTQMFVLFALSKHGRMNMSQLSNMTNLPMSTLSGVVDKLEDNEMVKRIRDPKDRRIITVELSEKSGEKIYSHFKTIKSKLDVIVRNMDDDELKAVNKFLDSIIGAM